MLQNLINDGDVVIVTLKHFFPFYSNIAYFVLTWPLVCLFFHNFFHFLAFLGGITEVPTVRSIQRLIEKSWDKYIFFVFFLQYSIII